MAGFSGLRFKATYYGDEISLNDGDAMYFDPSAPHNYRREGRSSCSAVVVVVPDV